MPRTTPRVASTAREDSLEAFARALGAELARERESHAQTERRCVQARESERQLCKRHRALKDKYTRLLSIVQAEQSTRTSVPDDKQTAAAGGGEVHEAHCATHAVPPPQLQSLHLSPPTPRSPSPPPPPQHARHPVTRKERSELPARTCRSCEAFYEATGIRVDNCSHRLSGLQRIGRHRSAALLEATPDDFWKMSFGDDDGVQSAMEVEHDRQTFNGKPRIERVAIDEWGFGGRL